MEADHHRRSFDEVPCGYVVLEAGGRIVHANASFLKLAAPVLEQTSAETFQALLSASGKLFFETQVMAVLLLEERVEEVALELVHRAGDGPPVRVPMLINARLERDAHGTPRSIHLAVFGAVRRRVHERELMQGLKASQQMVEMVRRSSDAILAVNKDGLIESWNEGAEQIFGVTRSEAEGSAFAALVVPEMPFEEYSEILSRLHEGKAVILEALIPHRGGHAITISISLSPHIEPPGLLVAFSAMIRDVTAQKCAERALIRSEKLASVGRLASSIAHEINNPLESVTNLLYLLHMQVKDTELQHLVSTAQEELARVSQIATHTLRFHRQSSSRVSLEIPALFTSILTLYRARLRDSGITATIDRSDFTPLVCYDGELRQVITNLIGNAFDAMRNGGRLMLRCREATLWSSERRGVRITIADSGTGMDRETLRHIFEPFFTTKGIAGTGLGLWVAQELVEKNNGTIRARSSIAANRTGTVFVLLFPHEPI